MVSCPARLAIHKIMSIRPRHTWTWFVRMCGAGHDASDDGDPCKRPRLTPDPRRYRVMSALTIHTRVTFTLAWTHAHVHAFARTGTLAFAYTCWICMCMSSPSPRQLRTTREGTDVYTQWHMLMHVKIRGATYTHMHSRDMSQTIFRWPGNASCPKKRHDLFLKRALSSEIKSRLKRTERKK